MKNVAGMWIDHRKAVIVALSDSGESTAVIESNVERQYRHMKPGQFMVDPLESTRENADGKQHRGYEGNISGFYREVIDSVRDASALLVMGPGDAKNELKKMMDKKYPGDRKITVEAADRMTDPQVAVKVRTFFRAQ